MKRTVLIASLGAVSLGLAACGGYEKEASYEKDNAAYSAEGKEGAYTTEGGAAYAAPGQTAAVTFPRGSRIVVEDGVTYRIDPGDVRVRLGDNDSRIVVDEGTRFRVDPDGTRVRIDDDGLQVDVGDVDLDVNN